ALATALRARYSLAELQIQELAWRRHAEVADLLLGSDDRPAVSLGRVAHRLEPGRLRALLDRGGDYLPDPGGWLRRLGREARVELPPGPPAGGAGRRPCPEERAGPRAARHVDGTGGPASRRVAGRGPAGAGTGPPGGPRRGRSLLRHGRGGGAAGRTAPSRAS